MNLSLTPDRYQPIGVTRQIGHHGRPQVDPDGDVLFPKRFQPNSGIPGTLYLFQNFK